MKPFNLEAALAGAKVVTRDGSEVTQLVKFNIDKAGYVLYGVLKSEVHSWLINGRYFIVDEANNDLFMAPNIQSIWVARVGDGIRIGAHPTKKECKEAHPDADDYHEITYEE
jgi:hypothetical protein